MNRGAEVAVGIIVAVIALVALLALLPGGSSPTLTCSNAEYDLAVRWPSSLAELRGDQLAVHSVCIGATESEMKKALPGTQSGKRISKSQIRQYSYRNVTYNVASSTKRVVGIVLHDLALPLDILAPLESSDTGFITRYFGPYDEYIDHQAELEGSDEGLELIGRNYGQDLVVQIKSQDLPTELRYWRGIAVWYGSDIYLPTVMLSMPDRDITGKPFE